MILRGILGDKIRPEMEQLRLAIKSPKSRPKHLVGKETGHVIFRLSDKYEPGVCHIQYYKMSCSSKRTRPVKQLHGCIGHKARVAMIILVSFLPLTLTQGILARHSVWQPMLLHVPLRGSIQYPQMDGNSLGLTPIIEEPIIEGPGL